MPAAPRKSSIGGARRGIQKAHIPYRGDNPAVGKKTGIAVRDVERKSDGFEPFEEIMQQADQRTPPLMKTRKKKKSVVVEEEGYDENGEMSMELDNSPMPYFSSARQLATPTAVSRVLSTSRLVARTPGVDFDKVPSPRPRSAPRRSAISAASGPSRLSVASTFRDESPGLARGTSAANRSAFYGRPSMNGFNHHDDESPEPEPDSPQETSFLQMDQDDDDDDEDNEPFQEPDLPDDLEEIRHSTPPKQKSDKGKGRAVIQDDSDDEIEVAHDLDNDMSAVMDIDEPIEDPDPTPKPKKTKAVREKPTSTSDKQEKPVKRSKKENKPHREGVRRSTREHIKPLEWWRGERYIYGRGNSTAPVLVPPVKEILRIPKETPQPLGAKRRRSGRGRSKSRAVDHIEQLPVEYNPEEGWDEDTPSKGWVVDYPGTKEKERRVAFIARMYDPQNAANNEWKYQKIFGDGDFIAAGQLTIPVKGRKPSKSSKDNTYIFYVAEGAVNFKVHDTSYVLATGGMIMVPRGNTYFIENIAERDALLVFTQARKIAPNEIERDTSNRRSTESNVAGDHLAW
ncbi:hypothetical protein AMATHDRAFT_65332 [Amanita thiersii Skay4041]|uniref:CENP-C homolog n=1 Tax=Amanita thiersii Skay4041 TaxID=703135 RepID=A0A2A9NJM7_9AGAR|nr:hypothetical protein AMATHDRAFT_65332 [Amanita thiersii Skay4041]